MVTENTDKIEPQPGILEISPYVGGKSKIAGAARVLKLSSNENPFGPSAKAKTAYAEHAANLHRYPSSDHMALRVAVGQVHDLAPDQIICGAGSDEIFTFLCQAYAGVGDEVIVTEHGFSMHRICALAAGATPVVAAEAERKVSVEHILAAITEQTRLVFVANPGNPTGTFLSLDELTLLAGGIPQDTILVLDGAYAEYADHMLEEGYDGGASLVDIYPNVVMTRTFSKVYGLGAARVGWAYANPDVIDVLNRVRGPFNVSAAGLAAAEAAMLDQLHAKTCLDENQRLGLVMTQAIRGMGISVDHSYANFLLLRFETETRADAVYNHLLKDGIIVRQVKGYGFPEGLRVTIGTQDESDAVLESLRNVLEGAG